MVILGNDWDELLREEFQKPYYQELRRFLQHEYTHNTIYPDVHDVFNALKETSFQETRVVILGQDPYINPGEAHGFAFSVQTGVKIPPSLLNIFKELESDCGCIIPDNGCLIPWAKQGVLLLNTVLTVEQKQSRSHCGKGWETFTDKILDILNNKTEMIIFMLWGQYAQQKMKLITSTRHKVLLAAHPSPLAGNRFSGCKHFSLANSFLETKIDWQIKNVKENK